MRTTIDIDPRMLERAMALLNVSSKSEAVNCVLAILVARHERRLDIAQIPEPTPTLDQSDRDH